MITTMTFSSEGFKPTEYQRAEFQAIYEFPTSRVMREIRDQLLPEVDRIWDDPDFQRLALTPYRTLLPGCDSRQRAALGELKQSLKSAVTELKRYVIEHREAIKKHWRAVLRGQFSPVVCPTIDYLESSLDSIESSLRDEWAWPEDYLGPAHDAMIEFEGERYTNGLWALSRMSGLRPYGNLMAWCLLERAGHQLTSLTTACQHLHTYTIVTGLRAAAPWYAAEQRAEDAYGKLRTVCLNDEEAVRVESAVTLVQLRLDDQGPATPIQWLPVPHHLQAQYYKTLSAWLKSKRQWHDVVRIRQSVQTVCEWLADRSENDRAIQTARTGGGLVIDVGRQIAYWEGKKIEVDWAATPLLWKMLLELGTAARRGWSVSQDQIYEVLPNSPSAYSNLKSRLIKKLPKSLSERMRNCPQKRYRLDLDRDRVHVFDRLRDDGIRRS